MKRKTTITDQIERINNAELLISLECCGKMDSGGSSKKYKIMRAIVIRKLNEKQAISHSWLNRSVITVEEYLSSKREITSASIGYAITNIELVIVTHTSKIDIDLRFRGNLEINEATPFFSFSTLGLNIVTASALDPIILKSESRNDSAAL
jgi:hypothetical protein